MDSEAHAVAPAQPFRRARARVGASSIEKETAIDARVLLFTRHNALAV